MTTVRRATSAMLIGALLLTACGGGAELTIEDARSRMSPMLVGVAAVFLDVSNETGSDDVLLSASVAPTVAGRVELHETFEADHDMGDEAMGDEAMGDDMGDGAMEPTEDGFAMMGMREVQAIDVPDGTTVSLEPGGLHVMLIELTDDLRPGDTFELTLDFEQAGERTVTVEVREQV